MVIVLVTAYADICQGGRLELHPNCRCGWSGEDMASRSSTAIPTSSSPSLATWSPGPRRQRQTTSEAARRFQIAQQPKMLFEAKAEILPGSRRLPILSRIVRNTKQIPFQLFIFGKDYDWRYFLLILSNCSLNISRSFESTRPSSFKSFDMESIKNSKLLTFLDKPTLSSSSRSAGRSTS